MFLLGMIRASDKFHQKISLSSIPHKVDDPHRTGQTGCQRDYLSPANDSFIHWMSCGQHPKIPLRRKDTSHSKVQTLSRWLRFSMWPGSVSPRSVKPFPLLSLDTSLAGPIWRRDTFSPLGSSSFCWTIQGQLSAWRPRDHLRSSRWLFGRRGFIYNDGSATA